MENDIERMEQRLIDALGVDGLLDALTRAMGTWELEENYRYIARSYDIDIDDDDDSDDDDDDDSDDDDSDDDDDDDDSDDDDDDDDNDDD